MLPVFGGISGWYKTTCTLRFQDQCDGTVIGESHVHMRLKPAGAHDQAGLAKALHHMLVKSLCERRNGRVSKGRPITLLTISVQRELGNNEKLSANVCHRQVQFALVIFKDAQLLNFRRQKVSITLVVLFAYTEKNTQSGTNSRDHRSPCRDLGFFYSLNDGAHNAIIYCGVRTRFAVKANDQ